MNPTTFDFYSGFEGEPELVVQHQVDGRVQATLHAWMGYFNQLMELYPAPAEGWSGLAHHHHMDTGWNEYEWVDPDPSHSLGILTAARSRTSDADVRAFADALIRVVETSVGHGGRVVWHVE